MTREPYPVYPLGLAAIAAALSAAGHQVEQADFLACGESEQALLARLRSFDPHYVCVSLRNLDNCDSLSVTGYPEAARGIVDAVKTASGAPVIIGGPAFSILPEELLAFTGADYGVVGEGERLVCRLLDELEEGNTPPPVLRSESLLPGEELPSPLYTPELVRFYLQESGMVNLQTKRGCPHGCIYCSYPALEGTEYRCRDPKAVVEDLERIKRVHGVDTFFFTDSIFNDEEGHYLSVVEEILSRELAVRWSCYLRPQGITRSQIALMKRSGLYAVELGTDAACDTTLAALGKGFTFAEVAETNRACVAERVPCAHFVMFGGPAETRQTVAEGLSNLKELEHCVVFAFQGIRILPGTGLASLALREGVLDAGVTLRKPVYYLSPQVDADEMHGMIRASFLGRRDRIFPPEEGQMKLAIMQRFGYRGLLWDTLIKYPKKPQEASDFSPYGSETC